VALQEAIESKYQLLHSTTSHINYLNDVIKFLSHCIFTHGDLQKIPAHLLERYVKSPVQTSLPDQKKGPKRPEGLSNISLDTTSRAKTGSNKRLMSPTPDGFLSGANFFSVSSEEKLESEEYFESQVLMYKSQIADLETLVAIERTDTIKHRKLLKKTKKQANQWTLELKRKTKDLEDLRNQNGDNAALIDQLRSGLQILAKEKIQYEEQMGKMSDDIASMKGKLRQQRKSQDNLIQVEDEKVKLRIQELEIEKSRLETQHEEDEHVQTTLRLQITKLESSLTEQAKSKEIVESEVKHLDLQLQQSRRDLEQLRMQYEEKKSIKDTVAAILSENEHINEKLVQHMKAIEDDPNEAFRVVKNLMEENDQLTQENHQLIEEKSNLEHHLRERDAELEELKEGNHRLAKDVGELQQFEILAEDLKLQLEQEKAAVRTQMMELSSLNEENMKLSQEVGRLKIELQESSNLKVNVVFQLNSKLEELSSLKKEKNANVVALKDLEMSLEDMESANKKLEDDLANLRDEKQNVENEKEKMDRLLTQVEEDNYRLKQQYQNTKKSLTTEKKEKSTLKKQRRNSLFLNETLENNLGSYKDENAVLKQQVKKLKQGALDEKRKFNEKIQHMMKQEEELYRAISPTSTPGGGLGADLLSADEIRAF